jgi:hypothetical protein
MKTKYSHGNQRQLISEIKTQDDMLILQKALTTNNEFTTYLCQKHHLTFVRNNKLGYGYCWKCRDNEHPIDNCIIEDCNGQRIINVYPIKEFHTKDIIVIRDYLELKGDVNMAWEEKKGMPTKEWEKKGEELIGKVVKKDEKVGENESTLYTIEQENGEKIGLWESGFLKIPMADVKINDKIKIIFDGLGKPKQKGFNPPKLFRVFIDK